MREMRQTHDHERVYDKFAFMKTKQTNKQKQWMVVPQKFMKFLIGAVINACVSGWKSIEWTLTSYLV